RVDECDLEDQAVIRIGRSLLLFRWEPKNLLDAPPHVRERLLGRSVEMAEARYRLSRVAAEAETVLLLGETGTGKEEAAKLIHLLSGRRGILVWINCSVLTSSLAESQLFGHEPGASPTATRRSLGYFGEADQGTLFLDEIGEMALELQPML